MTVMIAAAPGSDEASQALGVFVQDRPPRPHGPTRS